MSKAMDPKERKIISAIIMDWRKRGRKHCHAKRYVNSNILIEDSDISFLIKRCSCSEAKIPVKEFYQRKASE